MSILLKALPRRQLNHNASASIQVQIFNEEARPMQQAGAFHVMGAEA
jgi:hypothetical protein